MNALVMQTALAAIEDGCSRIELRDRIRALREEAPALNLYVEIQEINLLLDLFDAFIRRRVDGRYLSHTTIVGGRS